MAMTCISLHNAVQKATRREGFWDMSSNRSLVWWTLVGNSTMILDNCAKMGDTLCPGWTLLG